MANTRDLRVNIDGNPDGIDRAFLSAKASAEVFERELEKLERQQKLQEESLKRAEAATKAYGRANSDAAEKALKLGHAAEEAGNKARVSQERAKEAADKLAKGEITAKEAAEYEAKALRDVERAAIAAAAAQRASAKAAEDQARQEKQAARDAVVAAATQRLEHLRAAGAVKEHNALLTKLKKDYKEFDKGFSEMKTLGEQAFDGLKTAMKGLVGVAGNVAQSLGPGMVAVIIAALALLPAAATLVGGAITVGLGGAFAALGLAATSGSAAAKMALDGLKAHSQSVMQAISKPFEHTWVALAEGAKSLIDGISPDLSRLFKTLAPEVSAFANQVGRDLPGQLHGFFDALQRDFGPIISELGATLPQALGKAADGLAQIMDEVAKHPQEFGNLINATGRLIQALGTVTVWLIKVGEGFTYLNSKVGDIGAAFQAAGSKLGAFGGPLNALGGFMERFDLTSHNATGSIASFGAGIAIAGAQANKAATDVSSFDDAVNKILDPSLAAYEANLKLGDSFANLAANLKLSHGQMGGQTAATRASGEAFAATLKEVVKSAAAQEKLTGDSKAGQAVVQQNIGKLWQLAGSNKDAQQQVLRLASAMGVTLPKSAQTAKTKVDGVHGAISSLKSKTVTITADTSQAYSAAVNLQNFINSIFGHRYGGPIGRVPGYAAGGSVQHFPGGGSVYGPGTSTSDSIPAMLSRGEFVVNAKAAHDWMPQLVAINKGMTKIGAASGHAEHAAMTALPSVHNAMQPIGISHSMRPIVAALPASLNNSMVRAGASGSAAANRVDVYIHVDGPRTGLMGEIVKNLKTDVRTLGGGSAQVFFGTN